MKERFDTEKQKEIVRDLQSHDKRIQRAAIQQLKTSYWLNLGRKAILGAGCKESDVEHIFNDSLTDTIIQIIDGKYKGNGKLSSYLYGICRFKALDLYNFRKKENLKDIEDDEIIASVDGIENEWMLKDKQEKQRGLLKEFFKEIGKPCDDILLLGAMGYTNEEIVKEIGFKTANSVKSKAYRCRKRMRSILNENPVKYKYLS